MKIRQFLLLISILISQSAMPHETLVTSAITSSGTAVPYILNAVTKSPKFLLILFPGGNGVVNPHMEEGRLVHSLSGNFLLRARKYWVDEDFATITTNSTHIEEYVSALLTDLRMRFPHAKIYLAGTSRGTFDTMSLADYLSDKIEGVIHTSSLSNITAFNGPSYKNRQLLVHHKRDACHVTPFSAAERSHNRFGTEFIAMDGGISVGNPCEAFGHHGYNGIELETVSAIKQWVMQKE